jgi:hypothetical protein
VTAARNLAGLLAIPLQRRSDRIYARAVSDQPRESWLRVLEDGMRDGVQQLHRLATGVPAPDCVEPDEPWDPDAPLPGWVDMHDVDRGSALRHLWARKWDGDEAVVTAPCRYLRHPGLRALTAVEACAHAVALGPEADGLADESWGRLFTLAMGSSAA